MPVGLVALALGGFGIGLTEFVIAGLLPEVANTFGVSSAGAGWLITGYALAVAVGAVGLTAAVTRFDRKRVLLGLMVLFILGNLLSAIAPTYATLLAGRVLAALCHGAFFGIGSVVAASMVEPTKKAGAIAMMFTGLTVANVLGVPLGTLLGQQLGWRSTFWAITAIGVVAFVGLAALVPAQQRAAAPLLRSEFGAFRHPQVWLSLLMTVLGFGGMFGAFTYIAYTLTDLSGFASSTVPWLLILFGVGQFIGNTLGGKAADRSAPRTLFVVFGALALVMAFFAATAGSQVLTVVSLVLMGAFGFATAPALQMRVMSYAEHAPTLVSGANIAAFNVGNALGASIGALAIAAGLGFAAPIWAGSIMTAFALVTLVFATAVGGRGVSNGRLSRPSEAACPDAQSSAPVSATR